MVSISSIDPVPLGENIVLNCSATGDTPLMYTWTRKGSINVINATNRSTGTLTLSNLTNNQFALYTCNVSNQLGSGASKITVQQASECCCHKFFLSFY